MSKRRRAAGEETPLGWLWFEFCPEWDNDEFRKAYADSDRRILPYTVVGYGNPISRNQVLYFPDGITIKSTVSLFELGERDKRPCQTLAVVQVLGDATLSEDGDIVAKRIYKYAVPSWLGDRVIEDMKDIVGLPWDAVGVHLPWIRYRYDVGVYSMDIYNVLMEIKRRNLGYRVNISYPYEYLLGAMMVNANLPEYLMKRWLNKLQESQ